MTQDAGDEFGIVPILLAEHARESLHGDMIAIGVGELEVIAGMFLTFLFDADYPAFLHPFGEEETLGTASENLIGTAFIHANDGNPVLLLVLEAHHLGLEFLGAFWGFALAKAGVLFLAFVVADEHAGARAVSVDGAAFAATLPGGLVNLAHHLLGGLFGNIHGDTDAVVHPLLDGALHLHFGHPVDIGTGGVEVGALLYDLLKVGIIHMHHLVDIIAIDTRPIDKFGMEHIVFLKVVTVLVLDDVLVRSIFVIRINLLAAFVADKEDGFDARSGLGTNADGTCGSDGQQGDVATTVFGHLLVEFGIGFSDAADEGILLLAASIVDGEASALFGQLHT